MREERLRILAMVEDGKISVDEAERLFDALYISRKLAFEQSAEDFAGRVSRAAKSAADIIGEGVKNVSPKVLEVTKTVVAKTAEAAEGISKQVREWSEQKGEENCGCGCEGHEEHKDGDDTPKEN